MQNANSISALRVTAAGKDEANSKTLSPRLLTTPQFNPTQLMIAHICEARGRACTCMYVCVLVLESVCVCECTQLQPVSVSLLWVTVSLHLELRAAEEFI